MSGIVAQNVGRNSGLVKAVSGGGEWTLIQTITSDGSDDDISFTSGLDSTYDEYCFKFHSIHPETDNSHFNFNASIDGGSNYNVSKTTIYFSAYHAESDAEKNLGYNRTYDFSSTTDGTLSIQASSDADHALSGWLYLFAPSNTTFMKHFISRIAGNNEGADTQDEYQGGYLNTTSAVDAMTFKFSGDEIQAGSISLYGIG